MKDFTSLSADPSRVIENLSSIKASMKTSPRKNDPSRAVDMVSLWRSGEFSVVYKVKDCVKASLKIECNA